MAWEGYVANYRRELSAVIDTLVAMAGLGAGIIPKTLSLHVYRHLLNVIRPAESAIRRLIMMAARDVVIDSATIRPFPPKVKPQTEPERSAQYLRVPVFLGLAGVPAPVEKKPEKKKKPRDDAPIPAFPLLDPCKHFEFGPRVRRYGKEIPRISGFHEGAVRPPLPPEPERPPCGEVFARTVCRRLLMLRKALDDLPAEARRMAILIARSAHPDRKPGTGKYPRLPGWPPGWRKRKTHDVDHLLVDCNSLAIHVWKTDTS